MIPRVAHFVWFGTTFPWLNALALASAAVGGGFEHIVLHLSGPASSVYRHHRLSGLAQLEVRPINITALAWVAGLDAEATRRLFEALPSPAARSDLVRAMVLVADGGVYLDMDTVTVQSFAELCRSSSMFFGEERICFPGWHDRCPEPLARVGAYGLASLRLLLSKLPAGYQVFDRIAPLFSLWANNAVMGCRPQHPFMRAFVDAMIQLPSATATRPYALGPDLLERLYRGQTLHRHLITRLRPETFYPLAPVVSDHWWRITRTPKLDQVLTPVTLAVHWYASVRSRRYTQQVNRQYILKRQGSQMFSQLASRYLSYC